ncbi:BED-type domain-containing protein [Trichonephila clavipes]|nr:BED-type domain-containing protein [Trichonephila clavipes]
MNIRGKETPVIMWEGPMDFGFPASRRLKTTETPRRSFKADGFTVNAITKSNFIRKFLHDKGYSFPPNHSDVMKLVYKQYNVIKARVTNEISSKLNAGLRRSLTLDEFTSLKIRRYLNINVHFNEGEIFNLGMLRISGSFSAENCVKAVETPNYRNLES